MNFSNSDSISRRNRDMQKVQLPPLSPERKNGYPEFLTRKQPHNSTDELP
ncbi:MAG: hypothetical protein K2M27_11485 [Muribaculaceae bacterium]|nr:hypothetical protein [Muribaculaceae bacterium]